MRNGKSLTKSLRHIHKANLIYEYTYLKMFWLDSTVVMPWSYRNLMVSNFLFFFCSRLSQWRGGNVCDSRARFRVQFPSWTKCLYVIQIILKINCLLRVTTLKSVKPLKWVQHLRLVPIPCAINQMI